MYNLRFKISFTHLCWGIKESSLSEDYEKEISVDEGQEFNIRHQHVTVFKVTDGKLILCDKQGKALSEFPLDGESEIYFEENYEQYTDCITGLFNGSVLLK